jgi:hypothetical protein
MSTVAVNASPMANIKTTLTAQVVPTPTVIMSHRQAAKPVAIAVASNAPDTGHLRDHMIMVQRTASAAPMLGDSIGSLISQLNAGR